MKALVEAFAQPPLGRRRCRHTDALPDDRRDDALEQRPRRPRPQPGVLACQCRHDGIIECRHRGARAENGRGPLDVEVAAAETRMISRVCASICRTERQATWSASQPTQTNAPFRTSTFGHRPRAHHAGATVLARSNGGRNSQYPLGRFGDGHRAALRMTPSLPGRFGIPCIVSPARNRSVGSLNAVSYFLMKNSGLPVM